MKSPKGKELQSVSIGDLIDGNTADVKVLASEPQIAELIKQDKVHPKEGKALAIFVPEIAKQKYWDESGVNAKEVNVAIKKKDGDKIENVRCWMLSFGEGELPTVEANGIVMTIDPPPQRLTWFSIFENNSPKKVFSKTR